MTSTHDGPARTGTKRLLVLLAILAAVALAFGTASRAPGDHPGAVQAAQQTVRP